MKKALACVLACAACFLCGCTEPEQNVDKADYDAREDTAVYPADGEVAYTGKQEVSGIAVNESGEKYLGVDGKPFLYLGAQLRIDFFLQLDGYTLDDLEYLFRLASTLNITCIQVPIAWSDIETSYGVYSSELLEKVMGFCNEYGMRLEILWFGSYMCTYTVADDGDETDGRTGYVPNYILENPEVYRPLGVFADGSDFGANGWLGWQYLLMPNVAELVQRERLAMEYMMDAVYAYDSVHGGRHTVIGVQIENEADGLDFWRFQEVDLQKSYDAVKDILPEGIGPDNFIEYCEGEMAEHLSAVGMAVKESDYGCYTRTNLTTNAGWEERCEQFAAAEGIDFVGVDPYNDNPADIGSYIRRLNEIEGNFPHIAENGGEFYNNDLLQLSAFAERGGYSVFEVVCTSNEALKDWELRGVFTDLGNCRYTKKGQTDRLIEVNRLLKDGHAAIADHDGMEILNGFTSAGSETAVTAGEIAGFSFTCSTRARGVGYVAAQGDYVYFGSTKEDSFAFSGEYDSANIEVGYFDSANVWHTEDVVSASDGKLELAALRCYRIKRR